MTARITAVLCVLSAGCGGARADSAKKVEPATAPAPAPPSSAPSTSAPGTLSRDAVRAEIDAGFGNFLRRIDVEPELDQGRFRGWRIVALRPAEFWAGVDLVPGDVVVSVNGMPIERLTVSYLRSGKQRSLTYSIVETARP
jgi:hypothetical protein